MSRSNAPQARWVGDPLSIQMIQTYWTEGHLPFLDSSSLLKKKGSIFMKREWVIKAAWSDFRSNIVNALLNDSYAKMCILKDIAEVFPVNEAIILRKNDVQNLFSQQMTQKITAFFAHIRICPQRKGGHECITTLPSI